MLKVRRNRFFKCVFFWRSWCFFWILNILLNPSDWEQMGLLIWTSLSSDQFWGLWSRICTRMPRLRRTKKAPASDLVLKSAKFTSSSLWYQYLWMLLGANGVCSDPGCCSPSRRNDPISKTVLVIITYKSWRCNSKRTQAPFCHE